MNLAEAFVIAVVGFGSALLGASTAYFGSLQLSQRALATKRHGVMKALLAELMINTLRAVAVTLGRQTLGSYSSHVWDQAKLDLANFISHDSFIALVQSYSLLDLARGASGALEKSSSPEPAKVVRLWYEVTRTAYNRLLVDDGVSDDTESWQQMESFDVAIAEARKDLAVSLN